MSSQRFDFDLSQLTICNKRYLPLESFSAINYLFNCFTYLTKKPSSLYNFQLYRLKKLLFHAMQTVPYYSNLFRSLDIDIPYIKSMRSVIDLYKLPIIKREDLLNNDLKAFISNRVKLHELIYVKTSGSTGQPLKILFRKNDFLYLNMVRIRSQILKGLRPWSRVLIILAERNIPETKQFWFQKIGLFKIAYVSAYSKSEHQINTLRMYKPHIIISYPSLLLQLADRIRQIGCGNMEILKIFTSGEILTDGARKCIEEAFNGKVIDFYGAGEFECIAFECEKCRRYHINSDAVIVEVIKKDGSYAYPGEEGSVVGTNLYSFAMPIIRYELGDIVVLSKHSDNRCKLTPSLEKIRKGRDINLITLLNGEKISLFKLRSVIVQFKSLVKQFQFQKRQDGSVVLIISLAQPTGIDIRRIIIDKFNQEFNGNLRLEVIISDEFKKVVLTGKIPEYVDS